MDALLANVRVYLTIILATQQALGFVMVMLGGSASYHEKPKLISCWQIFCRSMLAVTGIISGLGCGLICVLEVRESDRGSMHMALWMVLSAAVSFVCLILHVQFYRGALYNKQQSLVIITWTAKATAIFCLMAFIVFIVGFVVTKSIEDSYIYFVSSVFTFYTTFWCALAAFYAENYRTRINREKISTAVHCTTST